SSKLSQHLTTIVDRVRDKPVHCRSIHKHDGQKEDPLVEPTQASLRPPRSAAEPSIQLLRRECRWPVLFLLLVFIFETAFLCWGVFANNFSLRIGFSPHRAFGTPDDILTGGQDREPRSTAAKSPVDQGDRESDESDGADNADKPPRMSLTNV